MMKKGLSPLEQKIYFSAKDAKHGIITMEIISGWGLASKPVLRVALHSLCKKDWFYPLKRGVYIVQPHFGGLQVEDPFYTAQFLYGGYIGFGTALHLHHLTDEVPFTVFVVTNSLSRTKMIGEYQYRAVSLGRRATGEVRLGDYLVSSVPKTLYDCLYFPEHAGGYSKILGAVSSARIGSKEWEEFLFYLKSFESKPFCQRTGYLLSLLKDKAKIPKFVFSYLEENVGRTVKLGAGEGVVDAHWKVEDCIGEKKLLSWWYHG